MNLEIQLPIDINWNLVEGMWCSRIPKEEDRVRFTKYDDVVYFGTISKVSGIRLFEEHTNFKTYDGYMNIDWDVDPIKDNGYPFYCNIFK